MIEGGAKPLLTIAVPTYNRVSCLEDLLTTLYAQLISEPRVELIISDNASLDDTAALVKDFQSRGLALRYIRNETNIGPDANFLQCFEKAQGRYIWIFGDDDIIVPGGLAAILSLLSKRDYDLIYVSSYPLRDLRKLPVFSSINASEFGVDSFVKRVHVNFTFISGNIINKERLMLSGPALSQLVGTNLVQLGWVYAALNKFERGLYIHSKLVGGRVANTGGYKLSDVFGSKLKLVTEKCLNSDHLKQLIIGGAVQRFWPGLLYEFKKSAGSFEIDSSQSATLTSEFKRYCRYWFFVYPILVLPMGLCGAWFFLTRIVNRIDKACGYLL